MEEIGKAVTVVSYTKLKTVLIAAAKAKLVTLIEGSPGVGKSGVVHQVAEMLNLKLIDKRLSEEDPTGIQGFPTIIDGRSSYAPPDWLPIEGDELPINETTSEPYNGWLLFLDEFRSAPKATQTASFKLIHDRAVGLKKLHKKVIIVCASNKDTDNAFVEEMSTATQSRLTHVELEMNPKEWIDHAIERKFDHRVISYIQFKPQALYNFDPNHQDKTFPCPRTWEMASRIMKTDADDSDKKVLLAGSITQGAALEFLGFCKVYNDLPKIADILKAPETIPVPNELSTKWAICGSLAAHTTMDNIDILMKYVVRFPKEFQVVILRQMRKYVPTIARTKVVIDWSMNIGMEFF